MEIKEEHIREAELLLIDGNHFDEGERIPFIKNLFSADLLAVPGSGKTTALQAKLYCLSKYLPFDSGSGILVLSHTNAAIEEIEKNLKKHSPKLFEYPNFVGTVQSFVNKFLTMPYYSNKNKQKIITIDTGVYSNILKNNVLFEKSGVQNEIKRLFRTPKLDWLYDFRIDTRSDTHQFQILKTYSNESIEIRKPKGITKKENYTDWTEEEKQKIEQNLIKIKTDLLTKGILSYEDSYFYAELYLKKYPSIKEVLQKRFKYVFVDEMQDLESLQIELIDSIFYSNKSNTIIQRIGDINQAIYSSGRKVKVDADWVPREQTQYITGSNRLTPEIASVVNYFTLNPQQDKSGEPLFIVNGLRTLNNTINPHLIIYSEETKELLKGKFIELIKKFSLQETKEAEKYGFKIIGWNAKWKDGEDHSGKLRIEDIFTEFKKEPVEKKRVLNSLSSYLQNFKKDSNSLKIVRDNILDSLLMVLRCDGKTYSIWKRGKEVTRYYSHIELIQQIKIDPNRYNYFKIKLYEWSFSLITIKNYSEIYSSIRTFIENEFKDWFCLSITQETKNFLGEEFKEIAIEDISKQSQKGSNEEIKIDIGTVHSSKGQTHCATLYVETSYHKYETEKLKVSVKKKNIQRTLNNPLFKQEHEYRNNKDILAKQTVKMMYVGFSRPTHLLCFACLKKNVKDDIELFRNVGWEIVELQANNKV